MSALPIVILGGIVKAEKLRTLAAETWHEIEWIPTHGMKVMNSLEGRIRRGRVALVIILEGLMTHRHYDSAVTAARASGVPVAYAGKAGLAALRRAIATIATIATIAAPSATAETKED